MIIRYVRRRNFVVHILIVVDMLNVEVQAAKSFPAIFPKTICPRSSICQCEADDEIEGFLV